VSAAAAPRARAGAARRNMAPARRAAAAPQSVQGEQQDCVIACHGCLSTTSWQPLRSAFQRHFAEPRPGIQHSHFAEGGTGICWLGLGIRSAHLDALYSLFAVQPCRRCAVAANVRWAGAQRSQRPACRCRLLGCALSQAIASALHGGACSDAQCTAVGAHAR
jgi:hypothetical protein